MLDSTGAMSVVLNEAIAYNKGKLNIKKALAVASQIVSRSDVKPLLGGSVALSYLDTGKCHRPQAQPKVVFLV